jgi:16S rRNA (uracil1498-N3)-methyltransferase
MNRFYTGETKDRSGTLELKDHVWLNDDELVNQITRVLRMRRGEELVLFDAKGLERLYRVEEIEPKAVHLYHVTDLVPKYPNRKLTLAFSMLKKDKNEWVLQKCTELGVTHFIPMLSDRTEKTGFDSERAHKIVVEAVEQCGRHDIPVISEPQSLVSVVSEYADHFPIFVADMGNESAVSPEVEKLMVLIGPEGGWSDHERVLFNEKNLSHIGLGDFTLRAETACIAATQVFL